MTLVVNAGPLAALASRRERWHHEVKATLRAEDGDLLVPAPVTTEVDYLLRSRFGQEAARAFLTDLADGRYQVVSLDAAAHARALELDRQYADLDLGLADLSLMVVAERAHVVRLLTLDQRHFRAVRTHTGQPFTLLPFDS